MAPNSGLSGKLLPVRFQPEEDELLSSWICRLALANGTDSAAFCAAILPQRRLIRVVKAHGIDSRASDEVLTALAEKTGTPVHRANATTLTAYAGALLERWNSDAGQLWTIHIPNPPRQSDQALQYCPLCLTTGIPYYRRSWRLAPITLCTKHRVQLLDRCAKCASPISFLRATSHGLRRPPSDRMTFCYSCKADLRDARAKKASHRRPPSDHELSLQHRLEKALHERWIEIAGAGVVHSLLFFPVLNRLTHLLAIGETGMRLRKSLSRKYGINMFDVTFLTRRRRLNQLTVGERRGLLEMAGLLLANWPADFIDFCLTNHISAHLLLGQSKEVPFWLQTVVNKYLYRPVYVPPAGEIESAMSYLKKMKRQYGHRVRPYSKEMRAVRKFLTKSSTRQREIRQIYLLRVKSMGRQTRPRRMSDALWKEVETLIISRLRVLRLPSDERRKILDGMIYVLYTGCPWQAMPAKFGSVKSARSMYYHLKRKGMYDEIMELCSNLFDE